MNSLLVTAVVLSSFALPGFAEQRDQKPKEQESRLTHRRAVVARKKQPDSKAAQPASHAKPILGPQIPVARQVPPKAHTPFEQPTHATPPAARQVPSHRVAQNRVMPVVRPRSVLAQNPHMHNFIQARTLAYRKAYNTQLMTLHKRYLASSYLAPLRTAYRPWFKVGFRAYAYPVRPVVEFYTYFSNPCVAWFYNEYDAEFYQPFYGRYVARYPELGRGYNHIGIYLPTEEFMAMNVALSDLSIEMQVNYRRAMVFLGDRLAERYRAPIARHQVIVNHYAMLPSNRAVVIEGFVDNESTQMPFKALVDLNNADNSELFAVSAWKSEETPTVEQSQDLYEMNDQIVNLGGSVETSDSEPQT